MFRLIATFALTAVTASGAAAGSDTPPPYTSDTGYVFHTPHAAATPHGLSFGKTPGWHADYTPYDGGTPPAEYTPYHGDTPHTRYVPYPAPKPVKRPKPPVLVFYKAPYVPLTTYYTPKIAYPTCPKGFYETYRSVDAYACAAMPTPYELKAYVHAAQSETCGSLHWDIHGVHVGGTVHHPIVRWVCKHG